MKAILKQVIFDQREIARPLGVNRKIPQRLVDCPEVLIISGVRRCGKSVLLQQIREQQPEKDYFFNFDDDRLSKFTVDDFQPLYEVFLELFGEQQAFYFDEIQNIKGWELFVRRLYDKGYKVFITGSNANMLSRELGTHLTGRYCSYELYPFSFREYIQLLNIGFKQEDLFSTSGISKLTRSFNAYLDDGGFPQYILSKNHEYLKALFESIIYKDVLVRNKLTNEKEMLELVLWLASNVTGLSSFSSLAEITGVKHAATIKKYLGFLENTYLLFQVPKFDYSLRKQMANAKKTFFIDNALIRKIGFSFSDNLGHMLENLVFLELRRRGFELFYFHGKAECDFLVRKDKRIVQAIQACYLLDRENEARELRGLLSALDFASLDNGLIITANREGEMTYHGKKVFILPAWKWLLEEA